MKQGRWSWVGASSTGTSHLVGGVGCDDACACLETSTLGGAALICVVSDGAGSASHSRIGSRIAVRSFCRSALAYVRDGGLALDLGKDLASEWMDDLRDRIALAASRSGLSRRSFAATLVGCVVRDDGLSVVHVGDGACALRLRQEGEWRVPSWPAQGEYASTTNFVTDDPEPILTVARVGGDVSEVAVFTDGLERLALDFFTKKAFTPFFSSMFQSLPAGEAGRDRQLSRALRVFLDSPTVTGRTDDDKTIIMARLT